MKASKSIRKQIFNKIWNDGYALQFGEDARDHISNYIRGIEAGQTCEQMIEGLAEELRDLSYHCNDGGLTAFGSDVCNQTSYFISKFKHTLEKFGFTVPCKYIS